MYSKFVWSNLCGQICFGWTDACFDWKMWLTACYHKPYHNINNHNSCWPFVKWKVLVVLWVWYEAIPYTNTEVNLLTATMAIWGFCLINYSKDNLLKVLLCVYWPMNLSWKLHTPTRMINGKTVALLDYCTLVMQGISLTMMSWDNILSCYSLQ